MVDTDDVQGHRAKYENQLEKLESADIDPDDREEIKRILSTSERTTPTSAPSVRSSVI